MTTEIKTSKKFKGYRIRQFPDGNILVDIKRKQVSLVFLPETSQIRDEDLPDRYFAVSYNDNGYAVSCTHTNKQKAISDCIEKANGKIKEFNGISVLSRNAKDEYPNNCIVWWEKGCRQDSSMHYKCEYIDRENKLTSTGVGDTLEEALNDIHILME